MRNRIGSERGWPLTNRAEYEREIAIGSLYVGSPETVAQKIAATVRDLGASRFDLKYSVGTLPHERMLHTIELYGSRGHGCDASLPKRPRCRPSGVSPDQASSILQIIAGICDKAGDLPELILAARRSCIPCKAL